jgi:hypothetical protein
VRNYRTKLARFVIDYNPSLLSMENATGQTPQDVANTSYLRWRMEHPPTVVSNGHYWYNHGGQPSSILDRSALDFLKGEDGIGERHTADAIGMWKMCCEMTRAGVTTNRRKLVSLFDAYEVAKRLAAAQQKRTKMDKARGSRRYEDGGYVIDADDEGDPVAQWLGAAGRYRKRDLEKFEKEVADVGARE